MGDRGFAVTQQPRVSSNAAAEEAFVPLGRGNGKPARPTEEQFPDRRRGEPAPRGGSVDRRRGEPAPHGGSVDRRRGEPAPHGGSTTLTRVQRQMGVTTPARPEASSATAADFTAERYLRDQSMAPRDGWRRIVYWLTGGRVNLGPSPAELAERELIARAKTPVPGCRSIAVISRKGGVGKTTTTLMLGHSSPTRRADQIVVVMSPSLDSARAASSTLDWLNENGHSELVRSAVAVVNGVQADGQVEVGRITEHFAGRCRAVVQVPWDPHLAAGAETDVARLRPTTRHAYLEVAAAVADGFVT